MMALHAHVNGDQSLGRLLKDLSAKTLTLLQQEIDLAKTEITEQVANLQMIIRGVAIGGALALAGGLALLAALILATTALLSEFMSFRIAMWLAPLLVGAALAIIGYALIRKTLKTHHFTPIPRKTAESLQENAEWLRSKIA